MLALRRTARSEAARGTILLSAGGNLSEILAMEKSRARECSLSCICRCAPGLQLGADVCWRRQHAVSEENVADRDSRLVDKGLVRPG